MATKRYALQRSRGAEQCNERHSVGKAVRGTAAAQPSTEKQCNGTEKQSRGRAWFGEAEQRRGRAQRGNATDPQGNAEAIKENGQKWPAPCQKGRGPRNEAYMSDTISRHKAEIRLCLRMFLAAALALVAFDLIGHAVLVASGRTGAEAWPATVQMMMHMGRWAR